MANGVIKTLKVNRGIVEDATKNLVNYADIQNVTDQRLLGRSSGTTGPPQEISVDSSMRLSGGVLGAVSTSSGQWRFDTSTTAADPGSGDLRFNTSAYNTVTNIYISDTTSGGINVTNALSTLTVNDIILIQDAGTPGNWGRYTISGAVTDNGAWFTIPVTYHSSAGSLPANNQDCVVQITRSGGSGGIGTVSENHLLGRGSGGGDGPAQELTVGTNLHLSGTTLNATEPPPDMAGGRLSPSSTINLNTEYSNQGTIYWAPYLHNKTPLWDGAQFVTETFSTLSLSVNPSTANLPYDVFLAKVSGNLVLERIAWNTAAARTAAGALTLLQGHWVLASDNTRLYLGTYVTAALANTFNDKELERGVWNRFNRLPRTMYCRDTTLSWGYTQAAWQYANNVATLGISGFGFIQGLPGDHPVEANNNDFAFNTVNNTIVACGIGLDFAARGVNDGRWWGNGMNNLAAVQFSSRYSGYPGIGYHTLHRIQLSQVQGVTTWYGQYAAGGVTYVQTGMDGEVFA